MKGGRRTYALGITTKTGVKTLQDVCRHKILQKIGVDNIHKTWDLPLPTVIKEFLCTFNIPTDFALDDMFVDYNFNFPNHVHHKVHQIYPGKCTFSGTNILMKSEKENEVCSICSGSGSKQMVSGKTREMWAAFKHRNLMVCHLKMRNTESSRIFHIFDFPVTNLEELVFKVHFQGLHIPEVIVWDTILQLSDVLMYLENQGVYPWELCQPRHIVISERGGILMENMLLYLPIKEGSHFQFQTTSSCTYVPPEVVNWGYVGPESVVWGLGVIVHDMTQIVQTAREVKRFHIEDSSCSKYSLQLQTLAAACLDPRPRFRPSIQTISSLSSLVLSECYAAKQSRQTLLELYKRA
jgi:hypothetical protein